MLKAVLPLQIKQNDPADRAIKSESATDRDANGQQASGGQKDQQEKGPMSDEQFNKSIEAIKKLAPVQEHQLSVEPLVQNGTRFVILKTPDGKIFRRISEAELWTLDVNQPQEKKKGRLISKSA